MLELSNDIVLTVAHYKPLLYFLILLIIIFIERKVTSMTISMLVILLAELLSDTFVESLLSFASQTGLLFKFAWYCTWVISNIASLYLIYYLHEKLQYRVSRPTYFYCATLLFYTFVQLIDFADRATVDSGIFADAYQWIIFVGNIITPVVILLLWSIDTHRDRARRLKVYI